MNAKVVVVGSINMDLVARSPRIPHAGETVIGGDFRTVPGGKGANQAVAAARLGAQVRMLGRVGVDSFGSQLLDNLSKSGVDTASIGRDPQAASGIALIMVDDAGQNSILVAPGANMLLSPADMDAAEAVISSAQVMLLQLEIPLETVVRAVQIGHAHGVKVVLNPAPAQPLPPELTRLVDVLAPIRSGVIDRPAGRQRRADPGGCQRFAGNRRSAGDHHSGQARRAAGNRRGFPAFPGFPGQACRYYRRRRRLRRQPGGRPGRRAYFGRGDALG